MKKKEVPLWAKKGTLIWVEVRDKSGQEVLEYLEAEVTQSDYDEQILKIKYTNSDEEEDVDPSVIFERLPEHNIIQDLANIEILNNAELLKHLEIRYKQDFIHCYCGPTLVVINPYKIVEHEESQETWDVVHKHLKEGTLQECIPHLWSISARCWDNLFKMGTNQAICISGESGAGKTESTKRCMAFLTKMNQTRQTIGQVPIEDKILACNPLLEAFGNAKTFRNDNSSRFGKYTILYIDIDKKKVKGAAIENYLLEKSRICVLNKEERNYHIFYCFLKYAPFEKLKQLGLLNARDSCDMSSFDYLNQSGIYEVPKINDLEFYEEVTKALNELDFSEDEQDCIWRNIAAILFLGNCKINESSYVEGQIGCQIEKNEAWQKVIKLLEIDENLFEMALTHKELKVGASITRSPLPPNRVKNSIDSIAKEIYNRMFSWIILKLNKTLKPQGNLSSFGTIGILDIFGFEIFEKNSLEQFFINFANERLQSLYIEYIFKNECRIFEEEGLAEYTQLIIYTDNKPIINALEYTKMPPGIFNLMDSASLMNQSDEKLHSDIKTQHTNSQIISFPKLSKYYSFIVKHTAREVEYLTDGFVEKNKDELSPFLKQAFNTSYKTIVQIFDQVSGLEHLFNDDKQANPKEKFLGYKFRRDMSNLVQQLIQCDCQFIRCIKPNEFKKSDFWNGHLALLQIQYMGMLDSLKVRKQSYPFRFMFSKFFEIYQDLHQGENGSKKFRTLEQEGVNFRQLTKEIFSFVDKKPTEKEILYGQNRVFLQETYKNYLDKVLYIKQKKKKEALKIITTMFLQFDKKYHFKQSISVQAKSILISRDLLKSWASKLDALKFKNYIRMVQRIQFRFRFLRQKRDKRYQSFNMILIVKYLNMYKFSQILKYILYYKRNVEMMQAMMDAKIKDSKNRYCSEIMHSILNESWKEISKSIINKSVLDLQRSFRSYLERQNKRTEYTQILEIQEKQKAFQESSCIQKYILGYVVRARVEKLNRAAQKIQGHFRMKWMRQYFLRIVKTVKVLQKWIKKMYIRQVQINEKMGSFMLENGTYTQTVANLEDRILFGNKQQIQSLQNTEDYTKLPFIQKGINIDFGFDNYFTFIPKIPEIELTPKIKLFSLLIDFHVLVDTTLCYENTWAHEFLGFMDQIQGNNQRLLHLEIGDSFTIGLTDERDVFTWGLNEHQQCGKYTNSFLSNNSQVKNLSSNKCKLISAGSNHGVMVDMQNRLYVWGNNDQGQLGLGHNKQVNSIVINECIKDPIKQIISKENKNYLLTEKGKIYEWPLEQSFKPSLMKMDRIEIAQMDAGSNFVIFLSSQGIFYGKGENKYGELGVDDYTPRLEPSQIDFFIEKNEKIIDFSCGYKHVVCLTQLKKVFTWGCNFQGQLGQGDRANRCYPEQVIFQKQLLRVNPRSIQAGFQSTFILLNDRNLYFMGKCRTKNQINTTPIKFNYEKIFHSDRITDNFTPVKIYNKWSSMISATYIIFADFRKTKISKTIREKYIDQVAQEWQKNNKLILPLESQILNKNLESKYYLSPQTKNKVILKHRGNFQNEESEIVQTPQVQIQTPFKETKKKQAQKEIVKKRMQELKTPKSPNKLMSNDLRSKIQELQTKDPSKLTPQEQNLLKMYKKMF